MQVNTTTKLSARKWITLILVGLFGQFAWTIENMYFNVFLYSFFNFAGKHPQVKLEMISHSPI